MTPQERAEKIVESVHIYREECDLLVESIRVAIVEATSAELERRRDAEAKVLLTQMLVAGYNRLVREWTDGAIVCLFCGKLSHGSDEAKAHSESCPERPAVQRLAAREQDIDQALVYLGQLLDSEPAGVLQAAIDMLKREPRA